MTLVQTRSQNMPGVYATTQSPSLNALVPKRREKQRIPSPHSRQCLSFTIVD